MKGVVKWFEPENGYGFIETDELEEDVFVHFSALNQKGFKSLSEGDHVSFSVEHGENGPKARDVDQIASVDRRLSDELTGTHPAAEEEEEDPLVTIVTAKRNVYPWQKGKKFKARLLYTPKAPGDMYKFRVVEDKDPFSSNKYDGYILKLNPSSPVFVGYYMEEDHD